MSRPSNAGGWLKGTTVRKGGTAATNSHSTRPNTPQVQSTSLTAFSGVKDTSGRTTEYFSMDDQCPVCKSDRYLNPKLRLLVSACYHKMCESCIDRLFTLGPAPCPICQKILRKLAFTPQTFEDLTVEKEVKVRRRIAKDFNKRREDFPDLRSYNDYLEEVEDITFNLINDLDVAETEARIERYRKENVTLIELNVRREEQYIQALKDQEEQDRLEREHRALEARKEEELEREEKEKDRREIIDRLETSTKDAVKVIAKSRAEANKRSSARTAATALAKSSAQLLRSRAAQSTTVPDLPHVPLQDDWYTYEDMYTLRDNYDDIYSEAVREDREGIMRAGGYRVQEAWDRAVRSAVTALFLPPLSGVSQSDITSGAPQSIVAST
ncbi:CDK-activating kinase assembly factor MAT1-domain-containing protein [Boletus reticuloceps]|uniref:RNA polymerase II transcription factor B subunit 3 n=1 Tax=Boletus reticuloceps TaxID=495285 RepID=A0A8I3ABG9_9AGAM|nr:CDK-activating kinase assembly factor MAT1-domain-containing protein [Boletus reticuloceps]